MKKIAIRANNKCERPGKSSFAPSPNSLQSLLIFDHNRSTVLFTRIAIGHFRVAVNLIMKARLRVKFLL